MAGSVGGVFKLIANDGKADRMIMATELLNQRIKDIMCMRAAQGYPDPTPTLVDIERTHILFVNAHFKPFAAIGYEYNKVRPNTGQSTFGGIIQFSIPQFGDFFHDMVLHVVLSAGSASAGSISTANLPTGIDNSTFIPNVAGVTKTNNIVGATRVVEIRNTNGTVFRRYTYSFVNCKGDIYDISNAPVALTNFVRYCEFPGMRLLKNVKFDVNSNPLDEYGHEAYMFHQKFRVQADKTVGWNRLVGQEVPITGYSDLCTITGDSCFSSEFVGLVNASGNGTFVGPADLTHNGAAATIAVQNATTTARKVCNMVNGPQTPKASQPALDMWIPLIFWFNRDARLSIASVSIPYGQRFINIEIEAQNRLLFVAPGDVYLQLLTEVFDNADGLPTGAAITNYERYITRTPFLVPNSAINAQTIDTVELYINNIFLNPEIHDIYIKRIGFSLIRVYRFQKFKVNVESDSLLLSLFKWPIETIFSGMRPSFNIDAANVNQPRDWHKLSNLVDSVCYDIADIDYITSFGNADPTLITPNTALFARTQTQTDRCVFPVSQKTIDTISIVAHGIPIYNNFNLEFFSQYSPYHYGGWNIVTPNDEGAVMINFCLYPGTYQPSGHINVSRAREFYYQYSSSYVTSATTADLLALAIAINFLLISDGSAVLRYST